MSSLIDSLHNLERKTIPFLKEGISFEEIIEKSGLKEIEVMRALQWLSNKEIVQVKEKLEEIINLDKNGFKYAKNGLPEFTFLTTIKDTERSSQDLAKEANLSNEEISVCIGVLKKAGAIEIKKDKALMFSITKTGKDLIDSKREEEEFLKKEFPVLIESLNKKEKEIFDNLSKRKGIVKSDIRKIRTIHLTKIGKELVKQDLKSDAIDKLTPAMLKDGSWKKKDFRKYDVKINVPKINYGRRHFVNQAIEYMKKIWTDLGFVEMEGDFVHTAFKDLDVLFVPQDHPARAMQDTFYIKEPSHGKLPSWYKDIKDVHENGGDTGSTGWGGKWSKEVASENMLRTHTTVLSAEYLKKISEGKYKMPAKFFSVNKVFRNEALDWKHLFEFNQVEGIVVDPDANLKHLKGYLKEFFGKMGFTDVRMRPAHFPYTEPSVEVDVYNPKKKTWVELGGAGIFRPEVTKPLIGVEVPVLAWGLGMERIITEYFEITDLRELYKNDLKQLRRIKAWMK